MAGFGGLRRGWTLAALPLSIGDGVEPLPFRPRLGPMQPRLSPPHEGHAHVGQSVKALSVGPPSHGCMLGLLEIGVGPFKFPSAL